MRITRADVGHEYPKVAKPLTEASAMCAPTLPRGSAYDAAH